MFLLPLQKSLDLKEDTHELCYNVAAFLIGKGLYEQALDKLKKAEGNASRLAHISVVGCFVVC